MAENVYFTRLRDRLGDAFATLSVDQRRRLRRMAEKAMANETGFRDFWGTVKDLQFVQAALNPEAAPVDEEPDEEPAPGGDPIEDEPNDPINTDIRDMLQGFLEENQLPQSLMGFITDSLALKKSYAQIVTELRQTDEYKAAYPENDVRRANGLTWMSEAEVRAYRDEAKRLAKEYLGVTDVTQDELTNIIGKGWSLRTFETKLQRYQEFERWGPTVRSVLEMELGYSIDDERLFAFFDDTPTPELDRAYEKALLRGQTAILGLGVRPDEEAELLRRYGIQPEQAFRGYQELAKELPRTERLGLIDAEINRNLPNYPNGSQLFNDTPFATLFRAIQLQDADAIQTLQAQMAREVARHQGQGGAAQNQSGASVGLLTEEERRL